MKYISLGFSKKKKKKSLEKHIVQIIFGFGLTASKRVWFCVDIERERESERAIERKTMRRIKKKINRKNIVESIQVPCLYFQYFMTVEKYLSYFFPHLSY